MKKKQKVTINEIAKEAGVSITTVSRYLNHKFQYMSEETKQKIADVIESLHYCPNPLAQGLKSQSHTVAIVITNLDYPLCISVIRELFAVLHAKGFNLLVCETAGDAQREENIFRSLVARRVDGMVIQTNGLNNAYLRSLSPQIPLVFFDREYEIPYSINLVTNNLEISEELTDRLFREGYDAVLYLTEELCGLSTRTQRLEGYRAACEKSGRTPWVLTVNHNAPETFPPVVAALKERSQKEKIAVYTANGLIMLKIYSQLKNSGLRIPDQMGLATFDEPDWANVTTPPLTCISQPTKAIGQSAAFALLTSMKNKQRTAPAEKQVLRSKLICRGSTQLSATDKNR